MASFMRILVATFVSVAVATNSTSNSTSTTTSSPSVVNSECQTAFQTYFPAISTCPLDNTATFCANTACVQALSAFVNGIPVECQAIGSSNSTYAQITPATFVNMNALIKKCKSGNTASSSTSVHVATAAMIALPLMYAF
ncbi:hypothetical protein THRCLA_23324 [Thraustotheca clavata]|uniref:Secreted protein n=1 Tax=Thraustotheca clavata TaxID=74557 RepID=A0A1V9Y7F6_9STRA|nr:hypothetical protein THRCLA_23324 [Thraustotheca clavata]